jgi:hypothetical protein
MLLPFMKWCDETTLGTAIRGTTWAFPLIETIHILALAVLFGSILLIDFRLLGIAVRTIAVSRLQKELNRFINWSLVIILLTGVLLFLSEALKAYANAAFFPKIILIVLAVVYHYTIHAKAAASELPAGPPWGKAAGLISLLLWFGVGVAGRAIGFV